MSSLDALYESQHPRLEDGSANNGITTTTIGTATTDSEGGLVYVVLPGVVIPGEGIDGKAADGSVPLPCINACKAGDDVYISLTGNDVIKTPYVIGPIGSGDAIVEEITDLDERVTDIEEGGGGGAFDDYFYITPKPSVSPNGTIVFTNDSTSAAPQDGVSLTMSDTNGMQFYIDANCKFEVAPTGTVHTPKGMADFCSFLYQGSWTTGPSVTLGASASDFYVIDVHFAVDAQMASPYIPSSLGTFTFCGVTRIPVNYTNSTLYSTLSIVVPDETTPGDGNVANKYAFIYISGNTLTVLSNTSNIYITKIIGYKAFI